MTLLGSRIMTEDEYYAAVKRIPLHGTNIPTVFLTANGEPQGVPLAKEKTPEERAAIIERLKLFHEKTKN